MNDNNGNEGSEAGNGINSGTSSNNKENEGVLNQKNVTDENISFK